MSLQKLLQIILCRNLKKMAARTKKNVIFGHSQKKKQKLRFLALAAIFLRFWQKKKKNLNSYMDHLEQLL